MSEGALRTIDLVVSMETSDALVKHCARRWLVMLRSKVFSDLPLSKTTFSPLSCVPGGCRGGGACICGGERTTRMKLVSPSIMRVPGTELRLTVTHRAILLALDLSL